MSRNATYNIEGYEKERINKKKTDKANVNYKKLLNKKFNKSDFYLNHFSPYQNFFLLMQKF